MANTPFNPAAYSLIGQRNFMSYYDMIKREVDPTLVKRYGNQRLTDFLSRLGNSVVSGNIEYEHYEEDRFMPKIMATTAGAAAGATATFALEATTPAQQFAMAQYSPYLTTSPATWVAGTPVRPNDVIYIPAQTGDNTAATMNEYIVDTVNKSAGTFTAYPTTSGVVTPAIATAIEMVVGGMAFGEGSDRAEPMKSGYLHYVNNMQIFKEYIEVTGTLDKSSYIYTDNNYMIAGEAETYVRFANKKEWQLLTGNFITNQTYANVNPSQPNKKTKGLIPEILDNGYIQGYSNLTGFGIAEFENLADNLNALKGSQENFLYVGFNLDLSIDRNCRDLFKNGSITYGAFDGAKNKDISLEFNSLSVGNYMFQKRGLEIFNDAQFGGAAGFNYRNEGIVVPADAPKDAKSGEKISSLRKRYLADREMSVVLVDGRKNDSGKDTRGIDYLCEEGLEVMGAGRFAYILQQ